MKKKQIIKGIKTILFIIILVLIYIVSPKITNLIQNCALWLYELENIYITRVVELILCVSLISSIFITENKTTKTK